MKKLSFAEEIAVGMEKQLKKTAKGQFTLPGNHQPGVVVPKGGSCCANCKFGEVKADGAYCNNTYFAQWYGTSKLPAPPDEYCSDWWEHK